MALESADVGKLTSLPSTSSSDSEIRSLILTFQAAVQAVMKYQPHRLDQSIDPHSLLFTRSRQCVTTRNDCLDRDAQSTGEVFWVV
jgi:hypothetical protein